MKKTISVLLLILVSVYVFAFQQTYRADSEEVLLFKYLRSQSGSSTVEPTMPISSEQLLICLRSLDSSKLNKSDSVRLRNLIDRLENATSDFELKQPGYGAIDLDASVNLQGAVRYSFGNLSDDLFFLDHPDQMPIVEVEALAVAEKYLAGKFRLGYQRPLYDKSLLDTRFLTNFTGKYDGSVPYEAWISAGNRTVNLTVGRDKVSSGNGKEGNLAISDNFIYQNFAKASYVNPWISYDLTVLAFDRHAAYDYFTEYQKATSCVFTEFNGYSPVVINHRLSMNFAKRFNLTIFEGMLEYGNNVAGIRLLNPFMVLHNFQSFVGNNNNNYIGLEFGLNLPAGFEISGQFLLDQFQFSYETDSAAKAPNAYGGLLNLSKSVSCREGYSVFSLEAAYTSPCLYLKADNYFDGTESFAYYDSDLVVGNKFSYYTDLNYLGYKYGPNAIVLATSASYVGTKVSAEANIAYRNRGVYRIGDKINPEFVKYANVTPFLTSGKVAEHDFFMKIKAKAELYRGIGLSAQFDGKYCLNYENVEAQKYFDAQFTMAVTIKPFELFKTK